MKGGQCTKCLREARAQAVLESQRKEAARLAEVKRLKEKREREEHEARLRKQDEKARAQEARRLARS